MAAPSVRSCRIKRRLIMNTNVKTRILTLLSAALIAAIPAASAGMSAMAAQTTELPANVKLVTEQADLIVNIPDGISDSFVVKAYEILQLVINKDTTWVEGTPMTNEDPSTNLYVVTDDFKSFFAGARAAYTAEESPLPAENTLYLSYDSSESKLVLSKTRPEGEEKKDYIVIDNTAKSTGHKGKLEKTFFEADLVSRIVTVNPNDPENDASNARAFADWTSRYIRAKAIEEDKTAEKTNDPETFRFKDLVYGYYAVQSYDDATDNDMTVINQSILNVPMAESVTLKATPITIDKSVKNLIDANRKNNGEETLKNDDTARVDVDTANGTKYDIITANIGDVLQYRVESHIPSYTSYDLSDPQKLVPLSTEITEAGFYDICDGKYVYTFRDKMINQDFFAVDTTLNGTEVKGLKAEIYNAAGTDVDKTFTVRTIDEAYYLVDSSKESATVQDAVARLWEADYTSAAKYDFFALNFDIAKLKALGLGGRDIVITYNAELRAEALNTGTENEAKFTYSNDPYDSTTNDTITDKNKVYTYDMKIDKVFSDGADTLFDQVSFKLYTDSDLENSIQFTGENGSYVRADSDDTQTTDEIFVNSNDGKLVLHGLGEGTYYLAEQENEVLIHKGYNRVNTITVVITAKDGENIIDDEALTLFDAEDKAKSTAVLDEVYLTISKVTDNSYGIEFEVLNQKGFTLPLTGELGNWLLAIGGIVLVAVGCTVIVLANKKKSVKK